MLEHQRNLSQHNLLDEGISVVEVIDMAVLEGIEECNMAFLCLRHR